jgi:hypothetical protein
VTVSLRRCHLKSSPAREPLNTKGHLPRNQLEMGVGPYQQFTSATYSGFLAMLDLSKLTNRLSNRDGGWGKEDQGCKKLITKQVNSTANYSVGWHLPKSNYFSFSFAHEPPINNMCFLNPQVLRLTVVSGAFLHRALV